MRFRTQVENFSLRLGLVQGISERRAAMPVLSHVLVTAKEDKIEICATDLETTMVTWCPADVVQQGSLALPARKLFEIVRELLSGDSAREGEIEIDEIGNHWVEVKSLSTNFKIAGLPSEDFPIIPEFKSDSLFSLKSSVVEAMISKTIFAVSSDELRRNLAGIFFDGSNAPNQSLESTREGSQGSSLRLVATDGHRLSIVENGMDVVTSLDKQSAVEGEQVVQDSEDASPEIISGFGEGFVVPKKGVAELRKILRLSETVKIGLGENFFMAEGEEIILISRLIDADFPNYEQVIPKSSKTTITISSSEFLGALKRVSILSSEKTRGVKFKLDKDGITLVTISPEVGEAKELVPVEYSGEPMELGFNSRYLLDVLEVITHDKVQLGLTDELSPIVIKPDPETSSGQVEGESYLSVIMPMRI